MRNYKLKPITYDLTIGWLYPDLMSTYGDRGNIIVLEKRCQWRGIKAQVKRLDLGFKTEDLRKCDLIFMGGAQDKQQKIVAKDLTEDKVNELKNLIERLYILSDNEEICENDVRQNLVFQKSTASNILKTILQEDSFSAARRLFETYYFTEKLKEADWNISRLANEIGVLQPNLSRKLKTLGINPPVDN